MLGSAPCAFVVLCRGAELQIDDEGRIRATVQARVSSVAAPARFVTVEALPETYSGKYMRRLLRLMLAGEPLGDLAALKNKECIEPLLAAVRRSAPAPKPRSLVPAALDAPALAAPPAVPSLAELTATVLAAVHALTGDAEVAAHAPLMEAGLDSLSATHLAAQLKQQLGLELSPTLIFEYGSAGTSRAQLT